MSVNAMTADRWWRDGRQVLQFALWGLASGCVTWVLIDLARQPAVNFHPDYELSLPAGGGLSFSDFSLVPGLVFGMVVAWRCTARDRRQGGRPSCMWRRP